MEFMDGGSGIQRQGEHEGDSQLETTLHITTPSPFPGERLLVTVALGLRKNPGREEGPAEALLLDHHQLHGGTGEPGEGAPSESRGNLRTANRWAKKTPNIKST